MLSRVEIAATYDRTAARYTETFYAELDRKPFDRDLLDRFAAEVGGKGPVLDLGCGPGHVTCYLRERGVQMCGLDLSRGMVGEARRATPGIAFTVGDLAALPVADASLAGIVAFYSIIHLPRPAVAAAVAGMARALGSGAPLLLAVHGGDGEVRHDEFLGERTPIGATLFREEELRGWLEHAGLADVHIAVRDPYHFEYETPRMYAHARRSRMR